MHKIVFDPLSKLRKRDVAADAMPARDLAPGRRLVLAQASHLPLAAPGKDASSGPGGAFLHRPPGLDAAARD